MDIKLKTLIDLASTLSFTKTSKNFNITQPAVTKQVKQLEQIYNIKIFATLANKPLELTKEGKMLFDYALKAQDDEAFLISALEGIEKLDLKIAVSNTLINYHKIYSFFAEFNKDNNYNFVNFLYLNQEDCFKKLDTGEIDFCIADFYYDKQKYDGINFSKESPVILLPKTNDLFHRSKVSVNEILKNKIIFENNDIIHIFELEKNILYKIKNKNNFSIIHDIELLKQYMTATKALTINYMYKFEMEYSKGDFKYITIPELKNRDIQLISKKVAYTKDDTTLFKIIETIKRMS